jgi:hypothetical protein
MNSNDAQELMMKLLDAMHSGEDDFIRSHNLTAATLGLLRKLHATNQEMHSLETILQRREEQERELEHLLLVELQRLP